MQNPNIPGVNFPHFKPKRDGILPGEHLPRSEIIEGEQARDSLNQKIEDRLNGDNTEDVSQIRFGAQEIVHAVRLGIASRMPGNNPASRRVFERANQVIQDREGLSGETFQAVGEPDRPSTRRQQRRVRKISKSIHKSRALQTDLAHLRATYGESVGQRQLFRRFRRDELPRDATRSERVNLRRAHRIARRTFKEIVREERRRERLLGRTR